MLQNRALLGATLAGAGRYTPSFVGAGGAVNTNISLPAGAQPGDFALLFGSEPNLLSGWTQAYNQTGALPYFEAHYRFLPDPVPSSYTFTNMRLGILMVFRNVDNSTPLDVAVPTLATTSTPPAITTITERCTLVVGFGSYRVSESSVPGAPATYNLAKIQYDAEFDNYWFAAAYKTALNDTTYAPGAWQNTATGTDYTADFLAAGTIALRGAEI